VFQCGELRRQAFEAESELFRPFQPTLPLIKRGNRTFNLNADRQMPRHSLCRKPLGFFAMSNGRPSNEHGGKLRRAKPPRKSGIHY
jgi:hypothetical protein